MHVPQTEVIVLHDGVELARVTLPPGEYIIGRSPGAHIRADTALLSRRHAQLTINYDHILLEDVGSSNGTFINEKLVTAATRIFPNQGIRLGPDVVLEIHRQRAPANTGVSLAPAQAAIRRVLPGEVLAEKRYTIGSVVAQGGMGAILDAQQAAMKRRVAMKVMLESADAADVLRFVEEAQVTGQLEHPNIVPVHELGVDEHEQLFYTMKFVRGITLKKVLVLLADGTAATVKKYPLPALLTIFQKACDALAFAHSKGVIHRDIKPENIMLGDFGEVLVMDWGLAKVLGKKDTCAAYPERSAVFSVRIIAGGSETALGTIMGTPAYMSPEQAGGQIETLDVRSDIYALGAILFEILHLRPAVTGTDARDIVQKVQRGKVEWNVTPAGKPVSPSLLAVCRKSLALAPDARYANVADLQTDVLAYQNGFATSAEKAGVWKQFTLFVKRHKAASIGAAAVLLVGNILGTGAILQGHRAERALTDLKKTAPAMRELADSLAASQEFEPALAKLDVAIDLDRDERSAYWRRAWLFVGMHRFADAAAAIRLAHEKDPAHGNLAAILPNIEKLATLSPTEPWPGDSGRKLYQHLKKTGASGEVIAIARKAQLGAETNLEIIRKSLGEWLTNVQCSADLDSTKTLVKVTLNNPAIADIKRLRNLLIQDLSLLGTSVEDLSPLQGMPLEKLSISKCANVKSLEPLRGMSLRELYASDSKIVDSLDPLQGMQITILSLSGYEGIEEIDALHGMPLEILELNGTKVRDLNPLKGMKNLAKLDLENTKVNDLEPLTDVPLVILNLGGCIMLQDVQALAKCLTLREIRLPANTTIDPMPLKVLKLRRISYETDPDFRPHQTPDQFWDEHKPKVSAEKSATKK